MLFIKQLFGVDIEQWERMKEAMDIRGFDKPTEFIKYVNDLEYRRDSLFRRLQRIEDIANGRSI